MLLGMCYSALIKANLKATALGFGAQVDVPAFGSLFEMRLSHPELKVPFGLDRYFILSQDLAERRLAPLVRRFHEEERARVQHDIKLTEQELRDLAAGKTTVANKKKAGVRERRLAKLKLKLEHSFDHISPLDERIFPNMFAPVILAGQNTKVLTPMRYRVRQPDGGEIPSQYNVFNARKDSLLQAATWRPLFGRSHALFPFAKFFEWVEREGEKRELAFSPENRELMWAASLFSAPRHHRALPYLSFAMITDDPPPEVAAAGHDRCPIFLQENAIETWLRPKENSAEILLSLLEKKEKAFYLHSLVA